jgi:hypothetical protein
MTEEQWLTCDDPHKMLKFLRRRASDRKLRLFACACCHRIWHLLEDVRSRAAVNIAERYAEGATGIAVLSAAAEGAAGVHPSRNWARGACTELDRGYAAYAAYAAATPHARYAARQVASCSAGNSAGERQVRCVLLRDLFGNPFQPVTVSSAWLTWHDGLVVRLAQAAYDNRTLPDGTLDKDRLAVLADALEEAGCQDVQILGHLRSGGDHVRGCWVVDCLLGKE